MVETSGIVVERDVLMPARDGVLLATDIYRPDGIGPFPVLLECTPYDRSEHSRWAIGAHRRGNLAITSGGHHPCWSTAPVGGCKPSAISALVAASRQRSP
jgi:predicted acyl esterase